MIFYGWNLKLECHLMILLKSSHYIFHSLFWLRVLVMAEISIAFSVVAREYWAMVGISIPSQWGVAKEYWGNTEIRGGRNLGLWGAIINPSTQKLSYLTECLQSCLVRTLYNLLQDPVYPNTKIQLVELAVDNLPHLHIYLIRTTALVKRTDSNELAKYVPFTSDL